jgi:hypothetical protein
VVGTCSVALGATYNYVLRPVVELIERWVPGMGRLKRAAAIWAVVVLIMGMCIGFIVAAEAGMGVLATLAMGAFGLILVPYVVFANPVLWPAIAIDLWIMSTVLVVFDAIGSWGESKGFWKPLLFTTWPGMVEWLAPAGTVNPVTGEVLHPQLLPQTASA